MSNPIREKLEHQEDVVSTNVLRDRLSDALNRAAYGQKPVFVTRRGRKIVVMISIGDFELLLRMKSMRAQILARELPTDPKEVGPALAQFTRDERDFF